MIVSATTTAEQFFAGLLGAQIGYGASAQRQTAQGHVLLRDWQGIDCSGPLPALDAGLDDRAQSTGLLGLCPWLLYRCDSGFDRRCLIAQRVSQPFYGSDTLAQLALLGDSLEFLMALGNTAPSKAVQSSAGVSAAMLSYLREQRRSYPDPIGHELAALVDQLELLLAGGAVLSPTGGAAAAIARCLLFPESLTLALDPDCPAAESGLTGFLLGAWRGIEVVPHGWLGEAADLTHLNIFAQQLYARWAGSPSLGADAVVMPFGPAGGLG